MPASTQPTRVAPVLVLAWGNPSRGDDALGPLCLQRLHSQLADDARVEFIEDFQLQVEHTLDLLGREQVLFVDASLQGSGPFSATPLQPRHDPSYTSHALSPQALLQVFVQVQQTPPPPCTLLAIRGERFELGEPLSESAARHLDAAYDWAQQWISTQCAGLVRATEPVSP